MYTAMYTVYPAWSVDASPPPPRSPPACCTPHPTSLLPLNLTPLRKQLAREAQTSSCDRDGV